LVFQHGRTGSPGNTIKKEEVAMSKATVLGLLFSVIVSFGFIATIQAAASTQESDILVRCTTCGVEFTARAAADQHEMDPETTQWLFPQNP
jgi:hypothetical protein